jgi:putative ubiquitin-RnfH superfamily antitoxin RatB of RatAB toxin-antitoxin module
MASEPLHVQVCYALGEVAWRRELSLPAGATAGQALEASGFAESFPGIDAWAQGVGVYGKRVAPETPLAEGDRVEIYRPLSFDPKESRRRRDAHRRAQQALAGRKRPPGLL